MSSAAVRASRPRTPSAGRTATAIGRARPATPVPRARAPERAGSGRRRPRHARGSPARHSHHQRARQRRQPADRLAALGVAPAAQPQVGTIQTEDPEVVGGRQHQPAARPQDAANSRSARPDRSGARWSRRRSPCRTPARGSADGLDVGHHPGHGRNRRGRARAAPSVTAASAKSAATSRCGGGFVRPARTPALLDRTRSPARAGRRCRSGASSAHQPVPRAVGRGVVGVDALVPRLVGRARLRFSGQHHGSPASRAAGLRTAAP